MVRLLLLEGCGLHQVQMSACAHLADSRGAASTAHPANGDCLAELPKQEVAVVLQGELWESCVGVAGTAAGQLR